MGPLSPPKRRKIATHRSSRCNANHDSRARSDAGRDAAKRMSPDPAQADMPAPQDLASRGSPWNDASVRERAPTLTRRSRERIRSHGTGPGCDGGIRRPHARWGRLPPFPSPNLVCAQQRTPSRRGLSIVCWGPQDPGSTPNTELLLSARAARAAHCVRWRTRCCRSRIPNR